MSDGKTNPETEVDTPQLSMLDVLLGSDPKTDTTPEQTSMEESEDEAEVEELSAEAESEEASDNEVEEEEVVEETPSSYTVKVGGDEFEVSLDELRNGYQRQSDYTRKSQSLAEQRKTYESNLSAVQQERSQYAQVLENASQFQNMELEKYNQVDWKELKESDPMEYMDKRMEFQDAKDKMQQVEHEKHRVQQQQQAEYAEHIKKHVASEADKLTQTLPEYSDPALQAQLREYAMKDLGFSKEDVDGITDHRVVLVLYKSMLQDKAAKGTSKKAIKNVPKVVKSGTPESKTQKTRKASQAKRDRLKKTGHARDAADVFLDFV